MPGITINDYFADLSGTSFPAEWRKYFVPKEQRDPIYDFLFHLKSLEVRENMTRGK